MQDGRNLEERAVGQSGQRNANGISTTEKRGGFLNPTFLHLIGLDVGRVTITIRSWRTTYDVLSLFFFFFFKSKKKSS